VVGNINVGGTGKTPLLISLVEFLQAQNLKVGVVSRGYGGSARDANYPYQLNSETTAKLSGDEPLLIFQQCGCPVVVSPNRREAVDYLLANNKVDVVLSDDGLQHYAMHRDIEIAVLDGKRGLGNGFCLPAGPLRELPKRLASVDFIIANGALLDALAEQLKLKQQLMQLEPAPLQPVAATKAKPPVKGDSVNAVAGIGNPERFFATLTALGFNATAKPFADHYQYQAEDLLFNDAKAVIMTSKDAVKCQGFSQLENHWQLPVKAILADDFLQQLLQCIQQSIAEKPSIKQ
jgi:tetraacyldisaccharide 4'-kinase